MMKMNNKGFTLVEVVVVVAILALIGVLVMPNILNSLDTGKKSSDRVLYGDIKEAMQVMYEEKAYSAGNIYRYDNNGKVMDANDEAMPVIISGNSISTNIQTLISNGFLTGVNNDDLSVNEKVEAQEITNRMKSNTGLDRKKSIYYLYDMFDRKDIKNLNLIGLIGFINPLKDLLSFSL